jgi:hypothetical protein
MKIVVKNSTGITLKNLKEIIIPGAGPGYFFAGVLKSGIRRVVDVSKHSELALTSLFIWEKSWNRTAFSRNFTTFEKKVFMQIPPC